MVAKAKLRIEGEDATAAAWRKATGTAQAASKKIGEFYKAAFAGFSVAALVGVGRDAIKLGDDLNKAAIKAGITGRAMSELNYVAKQSDIDLTSLSTAIKKMQVNLSEAATGAKAPNEALKAIGLTIEDLKGLDADRQFELIGSRIAAMKDPADRTRASVELFGKAGDDLKPMFENGAEGIRKAREEAVALGAALTDEQIKKLADADTAIKKLDASWRGYTAHMVSEYAPALARALDFWSGAPKNVNEQIADLEEQLDDVVGTRGASAETQRAAIRKKIADLRKIAVEESKRDMGVAGSSTTPAGPGFTKDTTAEDKAAEAQIDRWDTMFSAYDREFSESSDKILQDNLEREAKRLDAADEFYRTMMENEKKLGDYRDEQAHKLTENQQILKDSFLNAWDDMVNTGKFKIDELFKYVLAEFARRGLAKLFDSWFTGGGGGGGGGGILGGLFGGLMPGGKVSGGGGPWGWLSKLPGMIGFADGGDPPIGVPYMVGERGPEVRINRGPGTIIPNHALGGNVSMTMVSHIDARGATMELTKALPKILRQNFDAFEAKFVDRLKRNHYGSL